MAVGPPAAGAALEGLGGLGAERAVLLTTPAAPSPPAAALAIATWLGRTDGRRPPVLLVPHTRRGRELAAHLAVRLEAAIAPDAVAARRTPEGGLEVTRPAYGERLYATVRIGPATPAVVTLRPGALGVGPAATRPALAVEEIPAGVEGAPPAPTVRRVLAADPRTVDLTEAERIVAGGRGVGGPEGFRLLQELADLLGAALGGSRVAVDLGWLPWERQIGQSGRTVSPELYLAFGISGASQHVAGLRAPRAVVTVNADAGAPIHERAAVAAVADWRAVAEALIVRLRARPARSRGEGAG